MQQLDEKYPLSSEQTAAYRRDGFVKIDKLLTGEALNSLRAAVNHAVASESPTLSHIKSAYEQIFIQKVNLWTRHEAIRPFVISSRFGNMVNQLSGMPQRLWHDQALFKEPHTGAKTPWHQDAPYWPHVQRENQLTIWIALGEATIHNGCLSFVPETHKLGVLPTIDLAQPQDLFKYAPQIKPVKPVTIELEPGDATVHHGLTFHYAGPNKSDAMREAFAIIYMPDGTSFDGSDHIITAPLVNDGLQKGQSLNAQLFPKVGE